MSDFVINNGQLQRYSGNDSCVVIPKGVGSIGSNAFCKQTSLVKVEIPSGVKVIGTCAFEDCTNLEEVIVSDSVKTFESGAFAGCTKLAQVTLPEKLSKIGKESFRDCASLSEFSVPAGVSRIGRKCFAGCRSMHSLRLPATVTDVEEGAFADIEFVEISVAHTTAMRLSLENFRGKKDARCILSVTQQDGNVASVYLVIPVEMTYDWINKSRCKLYLDQEKPDFTKYDLDVHKNKWFNATDRLYAALVRMTNGYELSDGAKQTYTDLLMKNAKKAIEIICTCDQPQWLHMLFSVGVINDSNSKTMNKIVTASGAAKCNELFAAMAVSPTSKVPTKADTEKTVAATHPIEAFCKENFDEKTLNAIIKKAVTFFKILEEVKYADRDAFAPAYVVMCAIGPYIAQMESRPKQIGRYERDYTDTHIDEKADQVAAALDPESFLTMLNKIAEYGDCKAPQCFIPLCRFGGAEAVKFTVSRMNQWDDWYTYSSSGRSAIIVARGAILLNETREAMMYADKHSILGSYAYIRGLDAETLRDTKLVDFGLDDKGCKQFDLGNTVIEASVGQDLSVSLFDTTAQKVVKSLPKKGADPDKHAAATAELSDLKKNLKKVIKGRNDTLFERFLNGKTQTAAAWIASYTQNPVLHRVAELIVWNQKDKTFILTDKGIVDSNGNLYELAVDVPVGVAHPADMTTKELAAWQTYFTSHGLKQPFEQVWEPVIDENSFAEDRYKGCMIPFYRFKGREKHGISVQDWDFHNQIDISFEGCSANVERIDWARHQIEMNHRFQVNSISFRSLTRKVNHILAYLDRITVYDRIVKDDVSVAQYLPSFTLAQITEFIKLTSENNCPNVTAILLDFQQKNFPEFDPMAEFTLD